MFESLSERLGRATAALRGKGRLTDANITDTLRQVRMAFLEADVALPVVKTFIDAVKSRAVGAEVTKSLTPGQALTKIIHQELTNALGETSESIDLKAQPPVVILLAGLQGAGKTTTAAKLALWFKEKQGKKVLLASVDVYRPAAILQLQRLAEQVGAEFAGPGDRTDPLEIAERAIDTARRRVADVVVLDTAGRLHIDDDMMTELTRLHEAVNPAETLFVVDSMAGQDAVNAAKAFDQALPLTGIILTKTDGDARGGAALSVRQVTGKPIKFLGSGEKIEALQAFHPDRLASRILGMGDVLTLVEEVEQKVDKEKADRLARKLKKGRGFDFTDLKDQFEQMLGMGGIAGLLDKLPGGGAVPDAVREQTGDKQVRRQIAMINSMTPGERQFPKTINGSRKRRIATGSGTQIQDVNRLLKQFTQMQKVMKKMKRGGMAKMMRGLKGGPPPRFRG